YKLRARTVEPVFGQLKTCQKLTMMSRRGLAACENEWLLACAAHNLRKLHRHRMQSCAPKGHHPQQPSLGIAQTNVWQPGSAFQIPRLLRHMALCDRLIYASAWMSSTVAATVSSTLAFVSEARLTPNICGGLRSRTDVASSTDQPILVPGGGI